MLTKAEADNELCSLVDSEVITEAMHHAVLDLYDVMAAAKKFEKELRSAFLDAELPKAVVNEIKSLRAAITKCEAGE